MNKYAANIVYFSLITNHSFTFFQKHTKSAPLDVTREGRYVSFGEIGYFLNRCGINSWRPRRQVRNS